MRRYLPTSIPIVDTLLEMHKEIFSDRLDTLKSVKAKIAVRKGANPKFFKPRTIPFALRDKVAEELQWH